MTFMTASAGNILFSATAVSIRTAVQIAMIILIYIFFISYSVNLYVISIFRLFAINRRSATAASCQAANQL